MQRSDFDPPKAPRSPSMRRMLKNLRHPSHQSTHATDAAPGTDEHYLDRRHLKILSFNIQVGITTRRYRDYIYQSWRHLVPHPRRTQNLKGIADLAREFDVVALQEVDAGSLRSNFINQVEYLAHQGDFPYWYSQINRNFGHFARHSNGLLTRFQACDVGDHKLPGLIPGRGAIIARFGQGKSALILVVLHLALSHRAREQQLEYIAEQIDGFEHVILMGDMNAAIDHLWLHSPLRDMALRPVVTEQGTFPSWRPRQCLDHFWLSPGIELQQVDVLPYCFSDHLPIAVDVCLPQTCSPNPG